MPRIKNYVQDQTVTAQDKVIGSDVSGVTRNYTMKQIADFAAEEANPFIPAPSTLTLLLFF